MPPLNTTQGHHLMQELIAFLRAVSEIRPIGLVLEDMHWSDSASWDFAREITAGSKLKRLSMNSQTASRCSSFLELRSKRRSTRPT